MNIKIKKVNNLFDYYQFLISSYKCSKNPIYEYDEPDLNNPISSFFSLPCLSFIFYNHCKTNHNPLKFYI